MAYSPIQSSFNGGELAKSIRGQVRTELYARGLDRCENFIPKPQGSLLMCPGTRYVEALLGGPNARLLPFRTAGGDYLLELGDEEMRIYSAAGRVVFGGTNMVANGDFSQGSTGWALSRGLISHGRAGLRVDHLIDPEDHYEELLPGSITQNVVVAAGGLYRLSFISGGSAAMAVTLGGTAKPAGTPGVIYTSATIALQPGNLVLRFEADGAYRDSAWVEHIELVAEGSGYTIATPWTIEQAAEVQYVPESAKDRVFFAHPSAAPQKLTRNADGSWTFGPVTFTGAPAEWSGSNWPATLELFQGRLWLAGTPAKRNTFWASKTVKAGDATDFTFTIPGSGITDADAFSFNLQTKGAIRWMQGSRDLIIGTDLGEHWITSQSGVISTTDIQVVQASAWGSANIQALFVGDQVLYVSGDRRRVRAMSYDGQVSESWTSTDLTFTGEHLTEPGIAGIAYARSPIPLMPLWLDDGTLAVATYDRGQQVIAWWRRTMPAGAVRSAAVTEGVTGSLIWLSVERDGGQYLEVLELGSRDEDGLDCHVSAAVPDDLTITGLERLNGHTVGVIIDGMVEPDQVVAGGQVTLARAGEQVKIGLPYTVKAVTLPPDSGLPRGSAAGAKRRNVKAGVLLSESALPLLNGYRARERRPSTPMDQAEPRKSGRFEVTSLGWRRDGQVTIEQDVPLRTEVLAVYATAQVNDL